MVSGNAVTRNRRAGGYSLLTSLGMHVTAFTLLGIIVLNDVPEPRELMNVELVTATQQVRRLRRNMLKLRSQIVNDVEPPRKAQITAIKDAAPFPALPQALKREWLQIELPMDFRLRAS